MTEDPPNDQRKRLRPSDGPTKRSLTLRGHRTSVSLEPAFWEALQNLACARGQSVNALAAEIDAARPSADVSLASRLRVHILEAARRGEC